MKKLGVIPFEMDNETFQDVMAFAGPAPEVRVHWSPDITILFSGGQKLCNHNPSLISIRKLMHAIEQGVLRYPNACSGRTAG